MMRKRRQVLKLGGSVLKNDEDYKRQAERIQEMSQDVERLYVVLSAQKGETDFLVAESGHDGDLLRALKGKPTSFKYPGVAEYLLEGEIRSVYKMDAYLRRIGTAPAVLIQGTGRYPIVANHNSIYGTLDLKETLNRRPVLLSITEKVVLVSGFGGETLKGEKVLLGRNSSDLVAALVAYLDGNVDEVVYFKDVEGLYHRYGASDQVLIPRMDIQDAKVYDFNGLLDMRSLYVARFDIRIQHQDSPIGNGTLISRTGR